MTRNKISNTTELQSEQVQICASFGIENGILRDPQFLIGQAKLFDISAANQNQGGKCISSPRITRLAHKKVCFTESSLSFGPRVLIIIENNGNPTCSLVASELIRSVHPSWLGTNQKRRGHQPKSDWL